MSIYTSSAAKDHILQLYYKKLDELPFTTESILIDTSYGKTHLLISGQQDAPPLLLLHGANGIAPIALEALAPLTQHFRVYAPDIIGQPTPSAETRPDMKSPAYGKWTYEIISRLNLNDVVLAGISFGGFICWKTLLHDERRIRAAFLVVPAGIANGSPLKALRNVFFPMKRFQKTQNEKHLNHFLKALFSYNDPFAHQFLKAVFTGLKMDFTPVPLIKKKQARSIKTPLFLIGADEDLFFPGRKIIKRSERIFPSLRDSLLLSPSKHVPTPEHNQRICDFLLSQSDLE